MATRDYTITGPGGREMTITGPDNATPEQLRSAAEKAFGASDSPSAQTVAMRAVVDQRQAAGTEPRADAVPKTFMEGLGQQVKNQIGGLVRGAGSIGATLISGPTMEDMTAVKKAYEKPTGLNELVTYKPPTQSPGEMLREIVKNRDTQRRSDMDNALTQIVGSDPKSFNYGLGKVGAEVAGTAGLGGVLARGAEAVPVIAKNAPNLINAIRTSGMTAGQAAPGVGGVAQNVLTRAAGGAITGGASAGLVNPSDAGTGAVIGAVLPNVIIGMGASGKAVGAAWRTMIGKGDTAGAQALAKALEAATPAQQAAIADRLRNAETLVPGASPTVAQALQTPEVSILQRVIYDSPGGAALRQKIAQQSDARLNALESVAPTVANGTATAKQDLGAAIASRVIPEENAISKLVSKQYGSVNKGGTETVNLPVREMQAAVDKYMGSGTFSANADAATAASTAKSLSKPVAQEAAPSILDANGKPFVTAAQPSTRSATWEEVINLRASVNKAIGAAKLDGDKQALGALTAQKQAIDTAINSDLSPTARAAWLEANASHAAKMDRFHTGPQSSIFRTSPNGEPAVQGGEITSKFWGARPGAADDVKAFRRLVDDNSAMLGQFKSMVTTEGSGTADAAGNLTTKFSKWVDQNLPALREAFSPGEVSSMQRIAADIERAASANKAGTSLGGSNTYQNAANALDLGLIDSPALTRVANMIPGLKYATGPALEGLRGYAKNARATKLAELLSNPETAANALEELAKAGVPNSQLNQLQRAIGQTAVRTAPVAPAALRDR